MDPEQNNKGGGMGFRWKTFLSLVIISVIFVGISLVSQNEYIDKIFYVLLLFGASPFELIGLPAIESAFWFAAPSTLGVILGGLLYLALFYLIGILLEKTQSSKRLKIGLIAIIVTSIIVYMLGQINGCLIC